jgi:hypothetical protein
VNDGARRILIAAARPAIVCFLSPGLALSLAGGKGLFLDLFVQVGWSPFGALPAVLWSFQ